MIFTNQIRSRRERRGEGAAWPSGGFKVIWIHKLGACPMRDIHPHIKVVRCGRAPIFETHVDPIILSEFSVLVDWRIGRIIISRRSGRRSEEHTSELQSPT